MLMRCGNKTCGNNSLIVGSTITSLVAPWPLQCSRRALIEASASVSPIGGSYWSDSSDSELEQPRGVVRARVMMSPTELGLKTKSVDQHIETLKRFYKADGNVKEGLFSQAVEATTEIKETVSFVVNTKQPGLRALQANVVGSGAVGAMIQIARRGEPVAYEALQILCFRNTITCDQIIADGVVDTIAIDLPSATADLQSAMCYLLSALAAFSDATHASIASTGLVPQLVAFSRPRCLIGDNEGDKHTQSQLESRAAAIIRNLAHNTKQHLLLQQAGAVDAMLVIMRQARDPALRINAAVAVACLAGHEESHQRLLITEDLVEEMLDVLEASCQGVMHHGTFWTVWKLCQGFANLTINDRNKALIAEHGGVALLSEVLFGKHHNNEAAHRYALSALWNLAFNDASRKEIIETPGLVDAIRSILATTESPKTKEVAKGALWTLGLEKDVKGLIDNTGRGGVSVEDDASARQLDVEHVMLSYEWGCQQSVLLIKSELEKAGYHTWMDVDRMSGSTLEAMAKAVEGSAVVLICVSKKYKESQACRTEAEYAFQQRKKIIPIMMESQFKPSGWLGALMGTRLYFDMSDARRIPNKIPSLMKELGDSGRLSCPSDRSLGEPESSRERRVFMPKLGAENPENWSIVEVEDWLKRVKLAEHTVFFQLRDMDGMALSGLLRMSADSRHIHEVLIAELGIKSLGQRLRLIEELHRLFS